MNLTRQRVVLVVLAGLFLLSCEVGFAQPALSWSQPPGLLVHTNDPDVRGGNRWSSLDWNQPQTNQVVVADDFVSDRTRILRLRWWGSYSPGYEPVSETNFFEDAYVFSFFLDYANKPVALAGTYVAPITNVSITPTIYTGADGHRIFQYEVDFEQACLVDERFPDAEPLGFHGIEGRRYWLSIQAAVGRRYSSATNQIGLLQCAYEPTSKMATNSFWGWHTSPTNRAATSVMGDVQLSGATLAFSNWQANSPLHGDLSQAFEIFTGCDTKPPRIVAVRAYCTANRVVEVVYDEKVEPVTGSDPFNYLIRSGWEYEAIIDAANMDVAGRSAWFLLGRDTPLPCSNHLSLEVTGITDIDPCFNVLAVERVTFECIPCPEPVPGLCPPVTLHHQRVGPYIWLSWNSTNYVLEATESLNRPWQPFAAQSPVLMTGPENSSFYRLRCLNSL